MRSLRLAIQLSQKEFAALINSSAAAVAGVERGRAVVGEDLGYRIAGATGARLVWAKSKGRQTLKFLGKDWLGRPYTKASFDDWRKSVSNEDDFPDFESLQNLLAHLFSLGRGFESLGAIVGALKDKISPSDTKGNQLLAELASDSTPIPLKPGQSYSEYNGLRATFWNFGEPVGTHTIITSGARAQVDLTDFKLPGKAKPAATEPE